MASRAKATPLPSGRLLPGWLLLGAGDLLVFLIFAALGRTNHHEAGGLGAVISTAAPFAIGWFAVAPWVGTFPRPGRLPMPMPVPMAMRRLLLRTAIAWLCAWPVGLLLRAAVQHRGVAPSFALVALSFNAVLLLAWRGAYAVLRRHHG